MFDLTLGGLEKVLHSWIERPRLFRGIGQYRTAPSPRPSADSVPRVT